MAPPPSVRSASYGQIEIAPEVRGSLKSPLKRKSFRTLQEYSEDTTHISPYPLPYPLL